MRAQISAIQVAIMVPTMLWATLHYGLIGAASAFLFTTLLVATYNVWNACRLVSASAAELLGILWRPIAGGLVMFVALQLLFDAPTVGTSSTKLAFILFAQIGTGAFCYLLAVLALWLISGRPAGPETAALNMLLGALKRLMPPVKTD